MHVKHDNTISGYRRCRCQQKSADASANWPLLLPTSRAAAAAAGSYLPYPTQPEGWSLQPSQTLIGGK